MDTRIVAQFLQIEPRNEAVPLFENALEAALALGATPGDRELALSTDETVVRMERLVQNGGWLEGEVVRVQRTNIPPEARPEGLVPSRAKSQGHSAVFRFNAGSRILVIERNVTNMTPSRFLRYIRKVDDVARYDALPIPSQDVWERYGRMKPTRFSVTLSSITNPAAVEGEVGAILDSGRRLHEVTEAPIVHISVRAGGNPDGLEKGAIKKMIDGLLGSNDPGFEVTALTVSAEDDDDKASQLLNFLDDILIVRGEIVLDGLASEVSFERRMAFLRACFAEHMDYIVKHHGQA